MSELKMDKETAIDFFSVVYLGKHHIPGEVKAYGVGGWSVNHYGDISTYDFNFLTRLVFLAHDRAVRVSIEQSGPRRVKLVIFQRERSGGIAERHPTIDEALKVWRERHKEVC